MNIGYFITSHGFGHAARACAVMDKLSIEQEVKFTIFSNTPKWFFDNSLTFPFEYISSSTDVGLVQTNPFNEDLELTLSELKKFFPYPKKSLEILEQIVIQKNISLIICDISPLGLKIAEILKIPSILIENFTWDWIYESYVDQYPEFGFYISNLQKINNSATIHINCEPYCKRIENSIIVPPIFREPRSKKAVIKEQLDIEESEKLILISMGGIPIEEIVRSNKVQFPNYKFVIPINNLETRKLLDNIMYLPHNHKFFHPDLVNASDVVVGKVGYSTIAETYALQKPFIFLGRKKFRESEVLEKYVRQNMKSESIEFDDLFTNSFYDLVQNISLLQEIKMQPDNGATLVANLIINSFLRK